MSFIADKQTISDLNLLGKYKLSSIFSLFNQVETEGGERLLQAMFNNPLSDHEEINKRSSLFKYFHNHHLNFPFDKQDFKIAENYLGIGASGNFPSVFAELVYKRFTGSFLHDEQYQQIVLGLNMTIKLLRVYYKYLKEQAVLAQLDGRKVLSIISNPKLYWLFQEDGLTDLSFDKIVKYHYLLQNTFQLEMEMVLENIYELDVCIAVGKISKSRDFSYAVATPKQQNLLHVEGFWHPGLKGGISNHLSFHNNQNMLFLTGANMAGKSTLMKAFGVAVYLAHMGFPVAAKEMEFSVIDGIYSSINVADNLNMGHSHFYAEVLRVKKVAEEVSLGKNLVVLFDELFKGTNVKDAYDATLSVTKSFSEYRNCYYIISTHIIEVGEALLQETKNISYAYLPTIMEGTVPKYTYRLQEGITDDKQGMLIIKNEGILDILNNTQSI